MSDEQQMIELKLQLLHLAGGDTERAQHLLDWVSPKPTDDWPRACWGKKPLAEVPSTATFRAEHGTLYACIDGEIWSVELPHETRVSEAELAALSVPEVAEVEADGWIEVGPGVAVPINQPRVEYKFRDGEVTRDGQRAFVYSDEISHYRVLPIEPAEYEDPTAVAIAAHIEAEQADYPDLTDEQDAAIESATAEYQSTDGAEIVSGEPWSISASEQHAEESALAQDLAPLFPPEKPPAATPESLRAGGIVDSEASWWARKLSKEPA